MAVSAQSPINQYVAAGGVTVFPYGFRVLQASDLKVYVNGVLIGTGYSVSGVDNPLGGNVTFTVAPAAGAKITLIRQVPIDRSTDYTEGGALRANVLDADFDRLVQMLQDIRADAITLTQFQSIADQIEADRVTAVNSAATAVNKALEAYNSAVAALASEVAAAASAASALADKNTATTQAGIATTGASTATTQAGIATGAASTATTQAGISTTGASTATTQAGIATTQAGISTTQASNASASASAAAASAAFAADVVPRTSTTGSAVMPVGSTAQRDGAPVNGYTRFNTTLQSLEVYNATAGSWVPAGQGATGAVGNPVFYENDQLVTGNYTIAGTKNAISAGPITINTGVTVTVSTGATWSIV